MNDLLNEYLEIKKCVYKGETYFVRDNGAVMRVPKDENRIRKYDNLWTFGKASDNTGYMEIAGQTVHRIVAFAFHGEPPTEYHVVDHIDTNRRNNRPENLRWVTRLENVLENPITRARIESVCGSIEAFLDNPSLLSGHENVDSNFSWMKTVSKEEARISLARQIEWANRPNKSRGGALGDWIFQDDPTSGLNPFKEKTIKQSKEKDDWEEIKQSGISLLTNNSNFTTHTTINQKEEEVRPLKTQSLTPNAIQLNWKYPVLFPCCPQQFSDNPLEVYWANLKEGVIFSENDYGKSFVVKFGMPQSDCLWVMCDIIIGFKTHAFTKITFEGGIFYHENKGVYDSGDEPEEIFELILNGNLNF